MTPKPLADRILSSHSTSTDTDIANRSAALRGASHAFAQTPSSAKSALEAYHGPERARDTDLTGEAGQQSQEGRPDGIPKGSLWVKRSRTFQVTGTQDSTRRPSQSREQSPSHVAALLAASNASRSSFIREGSLSSRSRLNSRRPSPLQSIEDLRRFTSVEGNVGGDTSSLVELYESRQKHQSSGPVTHSVRYVADSRPSAGPLTRKTTLSRVPSRGTLPFINGRETEHIMPPAESSKMKATGANARLEKSTREVTQDTELPIKLPRHMPDSLNFHRSGRHSLDGLQDSEETITASIRTPPIPIISASQATETFLNDATLRLASTSNRSSNRPGLPTRHTEPTVMSLTPEFTIASSSSPASRDISTSSRVRSSRTIARSSDTYVPQLNVDSLANAIVASSLASSRAPSPAKTPPLPPPRRHGKISFFHHHHSQEELRAASPAKAMRQTMREPLKSDDEDKDKYHKYRTHRMRKHPNKHREGDRKRWRNQVNERERKRYEGVWAANKGLLLDSDHPHAVVNIVVRDIWRRSRLADDVLEEVWDLVITHDTGRLERDEFVVGMFLIDQRLKGNKLPIKVSESIWSSVRRLKGINMGKER